MLKYLKHALRDRLNSVSWMEYVSKRIAIEKVELIVDRTGYPLWMVDSDYINQQYINVSDFEVATLVH